MYLYLKRPGFEERKRPFSERSLSKRIKINQDHQKAAGHHGVPLNVYKGKYYFGQDDPFDELIDELIKDKIIKDFS